MVKTYFHYYLSSTWRVICTSFYQKCPCVTCNTASAVNGLQFKGSQVIAASAKVTIQKLVVTLMYSNRQVCSRPEARQGRTRQKAGICCGFAPVFGRAPVCGRRRAPSSAICRRRFRARGPWGNCYTMSITMAILLLSFRCSLNVEYAWRGSNWVTAVKKLLCYFCTRHIHSDWYAHVVLGCFHVVCNVCGLKLLDTLKDCPFCREAKNHACRCWSSMYFLVIPQKIESRRFYSGNPGYCCIHTNTHVHTHRALRPNKHRRTCPPMPSRTYANTPTQAQRFPLRSLTPLAYAVDTSVEVLTLTANNKHNDAHQSAAAIWPYNH